MNDSKSVTHVGQDKLPQLREPVAVRGRIDVLRDVRRMWPFRSSQAIDRRPRTVWASGVGGIVRVSIRFGSTSVDVPTGDTCGELTGSSSEFGASVATLFADHDGRERVLPIPLFAGLGEL